MPTRKLSVPCFTHSDLARSAPAGFLRMRSNNTARGMLSVVVCGETNKQGWWFKIAPKACIMHSSLRVTVVGVVCDFDIIIMKSLCQIKGYFHNILKKNAIILILSHDCVLLSCPIFFQLSKITGYKCTISYTGDRVSVSGLSTVSYASFLFIGTPVVTVQ